MKHRIYITENIFLQYILIFIFLPIRGKSLFQRLMELGKVKVENLAPNPGFEEGSGDKPAGWTTKSNE